MSAFDFFFPEQAQASHLRSLVAQKQTEYYDQQRDRKDTQEELKHAQRMVLKLARELAETQLVVKALMEMIETAGICSSSDLLEKIHEIDLRDGVADGQVTSQHERPKPKFQPRLAEQIKVSDLLVKSSRNFVLPLIE